MCNTVNKNKDCNDDDCKYKSTSADFDGVTVVGGADAGCDDKCDESCDFAALYCDQSCDDDCDNDCTSECNVDCGEAVCKDPNGVGTPGLNGYTRVYNPPEPPPSPPSQPPPPPSPPSPPLAPYADEPCTNRTQEARCQVTLKIEARLFPFRIYRPLTCTPVAHIRMRPVSQRRRSACLTMGQCAFRLTGPFTPRSYAASA